MEKYIQKRFGVIAIEKGFITEEQLVKALAVQARENISEGKHRRLGQILMDQDLLTVDQIDEVLKTMSRMAEYMVSVGR